MPLFSKSDPLDLNFKCQKFFTTYLRSKTNSEPSAPLEGEFLSTDETVPDRYQHIGLILMNVTRLKKGRELLLQPGRGLLQVLAAQLRSPSVVRRRGCAGALRNCFLRAGDDETLPSILEEKQAIVDLMHPISATVRVQPFPAFLFVSLSYGYSTRIPF